MEQVEGNKSNRLPMSFLGLALVVIALAGANLLLGRSEFGGYDLSALIDSGWRIANAQIPGVSFICTLPPSLYLATDLAFRAFGVHWVSVLLAEDVLYLVLCFLGMRLCWILVSDRQDPRAASLPWINLPWIYVGGQSVLLLSVNHLWHSTTASGFAAYAVLGTYTLLHRSPKKREWELAAHIAFAFAVLLLSKPNTAWLALLVCILCLLLEKRSAVLAFLALGTAVLADILVLDAFHITAAEIVHGYAGLSERAIPRLFFVGLYPERNRLGAITVAVTYLLIAVPAYRMIQALWRNRSRLSASPADLVCAGAAVVTVIGLGTNWDFKSSDLAPFLTGAALLTTTRPERYGSLLRSLQRSTALLCLFAAALGFARIRMREVGPWAGPKYGPRVLIHDRFFGDFETRQSFAELLHDVDAAVSASPGKRIFFGPRMEFLYAREGFPSPLHLPIWWHPGTSYPLAAESGVERSWNEDDFDVLVFAKDDRTRFPDKLLREMDAGFRLDATSKEIDVFYRTGRTSPGPPPKP